MIDAVEGRSPDFMCIGAQKAGTTWLHTNLRLHPRVWLPPVKELQYFNQLHISSHGKWTQQHRDEHAGNMMKRYIGTKEDLNLRYLRLLARITEPHVDDTWYRDVFGYAPEGQIVGDLTPEYSLLPDAGIEHVLRVAPNVRVIMVLRDPIDRAWSHLRMLAHRNDGVLPDNEKIPGDVMLRSNYGTLLERWWSHLPRERMHVSIFDDIAERPDRMFKDLLQFLGLEFNAENYPNLKKAVHKGLELDIPDAIYHQLKTELAPAYDWLDTHYPDASQIWRERHY